MSGTDAISSPGPKLFFGRDAFAGKNHYLIRFLYISNRTTFPESARFEGLLRNITIVAYPLSTRQIKMLLVDGMLIIRE